MLYTLKQSTLILEWSAPEDSGGRGDVSYSVACQRCVSAPREHCEPCGANVGFVPQQSGLSGRTVSVLNLLHNANYTFSVEARNGVSELLPDKRFHTQVNISTSLPGKISSRGRCGKSRACVSMGLKNAGFCPAVRRNLKKKYLNLPFKVKR